MRKYRSIFFSILKGLAFANEGNNSTEGSRAARRNGRPPQPNREPPNRPRPSRQEALATTFLYPPAATAYTRSSPET